MAPTILVFKTLLTMTFLLVSFLGPFAVLNLRRHPAP